jgi:prepilin-type N-terminal cleavage/methylation domain-containing protein
MSLSMPSKERGFSLAEVVISLAVLGLIASLTLPSLFMSMDRIKKRAVFKETYQAFATAFNEMKLSGEPTATVINKLNPAKICPNNSLTQGCTTFDHPEAREPGVKLATGARIFGINSSFFTNNPSRNDLDWFVIGLEDFGKKEYFYLAMNPGDTTVAVSRSWHASNSPYITPFTPIDTVIHPGQTKCTEQACLDMFNND